MSNLLPLRFTLKVQREIKKIKKRNKSLFERIKVELQNIMKDKYHGSPKVGDLRGIYSVDIYDGGVNYELAYRISRDKDGEIILVLLFGTRENFYNELKRYLK